MKIYLSDKPTYNPLKIRENFENILGHDSLKYKPSDQNL